jgi:LmbE family N-acetylglucosaminyl deacetylase
VSSVVDVSNFVEAKHQSMAAHATQMGPNMFFMRIPPAMFAEMFGREAFQLVRGPQAGSEQDLFGGL